MVFRCLGINVEGKGGGLYCKGYSIQFNFNSIQLKKEWIEILERARRTDMAKIVFPAIFYFNFHPRLSLSTVFHKFRCSFQIHNSFSALHQATNTVPISYKIHGSHTK